VLEILLAAGGTALDWVEQREYANKGNMGLEIPCTALCVCGFLVFQYTLTTFYVVLARTSTEEQLVSSPTVFIRVSTYGRS